MPTVQIAIQNLGYAAALAKLLEQDGSHRIVAAEKPDLDIEGIIVVDGNRLENLSLLEAHPDRFVVIARKDAAFLSRAWDAGIRHVVFEEDSPTTGLLAIIAAELRAPRGSNSHTSPLETLNGDRRHLFPVFPVSILDERPTACRCSSRLRRTR